MKLFVASGFFLLFWCGPALAGPGGGPPPQDTYKLRLALRDAGVSRAFDLVVAGAGCASAQDKIADRELVIRACVGAPGRLELEWTSHTARGESHATSTIALAHGVTAELGATDGPTLSVVVQ